MNIGYLIYEAERPKSVAEQRAADARAGEFAAALARLGRSLNGAVARVAGMSRLGGRAPERAAQAALSSGDLCVADLERLYSAPSSHDPLDSHGAGGRCAARPC